MGESSDSKRPIEDDVKVEEAGGSSKDPEASKEQTIDPENEVKGTKLILLHIAVCLCNFLVGLDFNLIATAVPVITTDFNSVKDVGWYGAAFQVALCSSQPLAGKTFVLFPKKLMYLVYLGVFEIGSLLCALSPSSNVLIVGRAIAGLGASGTFAGGFTVLTTMIPLHRRAIYTGTWSSMFAIASIVGPVIGGALTQHVTWRWCFYINLPIGGFSAALFILLAHFKPAKSEQVPLSDKIKALDSLGFLLFAGSITMLLLALQWGGGVDYAWNSSIIIGLFVGFAVTMTLFISWQLYWQDNALIPPQLFKGAGNRNIWLLCISSFFVNGPFQIIIYWLPIWFQAVLGSTPTQSGINYLPTVISDVLASFIGSAIVMKLGYWNPFLLLAEAFVCLAGGLLSTIYPGISSGHWIGYQIFGGIGYSLASNLAHLGMQASLPKELVPIGATTLLTIISTSCSVFLAVGQTVFQSALRINLAPIVSSNTIDAIISAGATNVGSVVDAQDLPSVIKAYGKAVTQVFYVPAAAPVISFILVACCRWTTTKK
ncbi:major facilitator superfamily domain-containing protein [Annulohypoxylon maeteangense]|uniref:major facilitator superfamily domain-containing protein n=1 Tax=Annulohypoxylon maeteangense TaxID=1927788 RepID=UPI00200735E4|nr:major facilitator superfamily domain-containing protein [Annulohypoxylon maeteangense]KAI0889803.1 major facilitator superfamily domain-containing protein [Annulohypoxylon maeteangense]